MRWGISSGVPSSLLKELDESEGCASVLEDRMPERIAIARLPRKSSIEIPKSQDIGTSDVRTTTHNCHCQIRARFPPL